MKYAQTWGIEKWEELKKLWVRLPYMAGPRKAIAEEKIRKLKAQNPNVKYRIIQLTNNGPRITKRRA